VRHANKIEGFAIFGAEFFLCGQNELYVAHGVISFVHSLVLTPHFEEEEVEVRVRP
jgi:hypothetical protein